VVQRLKQASTPSVSSPMVGTGYPYRLWVSFLGHASVPGDAQTYWLATPVNGLRC
jgi:hypothetical protein